MFFGRHEHSVDSKGRLAVPAKYRSSLGTDVFLTRSLDPQRKCLHLYPQTTFMEIADRLEKLELTDPTERDYRDVFFGDATDYVLDKQGRLAIPAYLREYAGILVADDDENGTADVVVVGHRSYIQIWSREFWREMYERVEKNPGKMPLILEG
jgi:MraZ protein